MESGHLSTVQKPRMKNSCIKFTLCGLPRFRAGIIFVAAFCLQLVHVKSATRSPRSKQYDDVKEWFQRCAPAYKLNKLWCRKAYAKLQDMQEQVFNEQCQITRFQVLNTSELQFSNAGAKFLVLKVPYRGGSARSASGSVIRALNAHQDMKQQNIEKMGVSHKNFGHYIGFYILVGFRTPGTPSRSTGSPSRSTGSRTSRSDTPERFDVLDEHFADIEHRPGFGIYVDQSPEESISMLRDLIETITQRLHRTASSRLNNVQTMAKLDNKYKNENTKYGHLARISERYKLKLRNNMMDIKEPFYGIRRDLRKTEPGILLDKKIQLIFKNIDNWLHRLVVS